MGIDETDLAAAGHIRRRRAAKLNDFGVMLDAAGHKKEALLAFKKALIQDPASFVPYFNIGNIMRDIGEVDRAIFFYEKAIELNPNDMDIYLNIVALYRHKNENSKAASTYRRILAIDPQNFLAQHFLMALEGQTPVQPPLPYVEKLFDDYAPNFDAHLTGDLGYTTPTLLLELIFRGMGNDRMFARGLDMGCGTGLMGERLRARCTHLTGIDVSRKMLDQAVQKGVYDLTIKSNIIDFLASSGTYDLLVAADVLPYFGDLAPLFEAAAKSCRQQGIFAFSTEAGEGEGYSLAMSGRYQHSRIFVKHLLDQYGFSLIEVQRRTIRNQGGLAVAGDLFVASPGLAQKRG